MFCNFFPENRAVYEIVSKKDGQASEAFALHASMLRHTYIASRYISWQSSSVICHTTGPQPLPKRFLHLMRSRASSFK
jgi:hypothetical protein